MYFPIGIIFFEIDFQFISISYPEKQPPKNRDLVLDVALEIP